MKIYAFLICFLLIAGYTHVSDSSALNSSRARVDGWWTGDFQGTYLLFNLKSEGDNLTGASYDVPGIPVTQLKEGKIEGDRITFYVEIENGANKLRADYKGDVKENDITFNYTLTEIDPQGNSSKDPMPIPPLIVNRIGTGNETYDEIKEVLKKKIKDGELTRTVQAPEWKDPSPHSIQFITVDKEVQLEVLDWGGSGRPVVLLAGLGNTAHVFDDFAQRLTKDYHVFGITRRGFGNSSKPASGYEADRLGDDVIAVLDNLKLERPVLVGHSIAGEELSSVASRFPDRISGMIYLDAAYKHAFDSDGSIEKNARGINSEANAPAGGKESASSGEEKPAQQNIAMPNPPAPDATDLASIAAYNSWIKRTRGFAMTEAELRRQMLVSGDGKIIGTRVQPEGTARASEAIIKSRQSYKNIPVRCLAIFAYPSSLEPWEKKLEPEAQEQIAKIISNEQQNTKKHITAFEKGVPTSRVVMLPEATHFLFISNEEEVLREMKDFLKSLSW